MTQFWVGFIASDGNSPLAARSGISDENGQAWRTVPAQGQPSAGAAASTSPSHISSLSPWEQFGLAWLYASSCSSQHEITAEKAARYRGRGGHAASSHIPQAGASALSIFFTAQRHAASMKPSRLIMRTGQQSAWTESILCELWELGFLSVTERNEMQGVRGGFPHRLLHLQGKKGEKTHTKIFLMHVTGQISKLFNLFAIPTLCA